MKEFELISKLKNQNFTSTEYIKYSIGDDCAVLNYNDKYDLLLTTDMLVEKSHFITKWYSPFQLVKKILYSNITDINSCGGKPFALLLSAGFPKNITNKFINTFISALKTETSNLNINLIGGDTVSSELLTFSVTMLGIVEKDKAVLRSSVKTDSYVYITGYPGISAAGLFLKLNNINAQTNYEKYLISKHLVPDIVKNNNILQSIFKAADGMIDVSDGLSSELNHLSKNSKIKIIIDYNDIPVKQELRYFSNKYNYSLPDLLLNGGEDYMLLFTSKEKINFKGIYKIGNTKRGRGVFLKTNTSINKLLPKGFEHRIK